MRDVAEQKSNIASYHRNFRRLDENVSEQEFRNGVTDRYFAKSYITHVEDGSLMPCTGIVEGVQLLRGHHDVVRHPHRTFISSGIHGADANDPFFPSRGSFSILAGPACDTNTFVVGGATCADINQRGY